MDPIEGCRRLAIVKRILQRYLSCLSVTGMSFGCCYTCRQSRRIPGVGEVVDTGHRRHDLSQDQAYDGEEQGHWHTKRDYRG